MANGTDRTNMNSQDNQSLAARIERQLRQQMRFDGVVAIGKDGAVYLSGRVPSRRDRQQALLVVHELSGGAPVQDDLFVERELPDDRDPYAVDDLAEEPEAETVIGAIAPETIGPAGQLDPDFTSQPLDTDDLNVVGSLDDEPHGELEVAGGFEATSMDSEDVAPSVEDNRPGDEALVEAIQRELREDATTTALRMHVVVTKGIARLYGHVPDLSDAENAEEVAGRVPGVREVIDLLDVKAMDRP